VRVIPLPTVPLLPPVAFLIHSRPCSVAVERFIQRAVPPLEDKLRPLSHGVGTMPGVGVTEPHRVQIPKENPVPRGRRHADVERGEVRLSPVRHVSEV